MIVMVMDDTQQKALDDLVATSSKVLKAFLSGNHPTEQQLKRLESALEPFTGLKTCGHILIEDCQCQEPN